MSDEPTERDVEALAKSVCPCRWGPHNPNESIECAWALDLTRAVLTSDWYAERVAQARREAWDEGYSQGVADERMSQETTAGEIPPGRVNPFRAALRGDA